MRVLALKKAEKSDEVIVRLVEMDGKPAANVRSVGGPVISAREVDGQERPVGSSAQWPKVNWSHLLSPTRLRTFAK